MNCYICPALAGYAEPVPGSDAVRPVCAAHRGPDARPVEPADLAAAALLGIGIPGEEH